MATRRKTIKSNRIKLTAEDIAVAAPRMMAAAQARQRASGWCMDKPDAKPPNIDFFFFNAVSFELILLSLEQSLRLLILLHYGILRDDTNHNPHVLYETVRNLSGGKEGIREDIVNKMNELGETKDISPIEEKALAACLKKHDSSYSNFRYFQLDRHVRLNTQWEFTAQDVQIVHSLALALIHLNMDEMVKRGIKAISSMIPVPESDMTEALKALKERLSSR